MRRKVQRLVKTGEGINRNRLEVGYKTKSGARKEAKQRKSTFKSLRGGIVGKVRVR